MTRQQLGGIRGANEVVNQNPFEILRSEHASLQARLRSAIEAAGEKNTEDRVRDEVSALRIAARMHMKGEETALFPVGERLFDRYGAVLVLRSDHAAIEAKLSRQNPPSRNLVDWLETLAVDLQAHLGREERVLFPIMSALMSEKEKERLTRLLRRAPG